jgi:hypothetical protein
VLSSVPVRRTFLTAFACAIALAAPAAASQGNHRGDGSGGVGPGGVGPDGTTQPAPVPGVKAKLLPTGQARAPQGAPIEEQNAIAAANSIDDTGYCTGGGHDSSTRLSRCYDCSGAVSYVLGPKGADILDSPLDSGSLMKWGERGKGSWITVYTNAGHAMVVIAGLRFDTSQPADGAEGPGWSKDVKSGMVNGPFQKRHFLGL